jgi:hypothetical protein
MPADGSRVHAANHHREGSTAVRSAGMRVCCGTQGTAANERNNRQGAQGAQDGNAQPAGRQSASRSVYPAAAPRGFLLLCSSVGQTCSGPSSGQRNGGRAAQRGRKSDPLADATRAAPAAPLEGSRAQRRVGEPGGVLPVLTTAANSLPSLRQQPKAARRPRNQEQPNTEPAASQQHPGAHKQHSIRSAAGEQSFAHRWGGHDN